ncbi:MAG: WYL domain-containing protein, partial [Amphibacillus sp.]|nr:WYL domain-containing protein [Amphibacillus sp.]
KVEEIKEYLGYKSTFNDTIVDMAMAMNFGEHDVKPKEEWRIVFEDFEKQFDPASDEFDDNELDETNRMKIRGLYYNHIFSYEEINYLIEGILFSKTIDTETATQLINKIEEHLTTKFYKRGPKQIRKVQEVMLADKESLRDNLITIQQAIDDNVQINFRFNGYNYKKELEPVRNRKDTVSPYYIVASGGRYYLLACKEINRNNKSIKNMSIWRIDLMTEVEIPDRDEVLNIKGIPRLKKEEVENLPQEWSEDFQLSHLNMSYDKPIRIKLKIKSPKQADNPRQRLKVDYTFMYDWFGDTFRYIETENVPPYDDIVEVKCSPYAMVNWALQYSDRVEVLEPVEVREQVIKKIKNLAIKYEVR